MKKDIFPALCNYAALHGHQITRVGSMYTLYVLIKSNVVHTMIPVEFENDLEKAVAFIKRWSARSLTHNQIRERLMLKKRRYE